MGVEKLKALLADGLFGTISEKNGRRFARLKESGAGAKLKQVDIYDIPDQSLLINLDKYEQPKSLFKGKKGECQRCDYILLTKTGGHFLLLFIEMKSAKINNSEVERQFKGAECVMDYCDATLSRFYDGYRMLDKFEKRFVVFYRPRSPKHRTRLTSPSWNNNSPENPLKYPAPQNPSLKLLV